MPIFSLLRIAFSAGRMISREGSSLDANPLGTMREEEAFDFRMQPQAALVEVDGSGEPAISTTIRRFAETAKLTLEPEGLVRLAPNVLGVFPRASVEANGPDGWPLLASTLCLESCVRSVHLFAFDDAASKEMVWTFSSPSGLYLGSQLFHAEPEKYRKAIDKGKGPIDALARELRVPGRGTLVRPLLLAR
jgi:hypothetical protein